MGFKTNFSFQERKAESTRIIEKYPDRIPIICEKNIRAKASDSVLDKNKYLVPRDLTVGQFLYVIRKRMCLASEKAIFLFVNGLIPPTSSLVFDIYTKNKDEDGFLYVTYAFENVFGINLINLINL